MKSISARTWGVLGIGFGVVALGMIWSIVNTALASIQKDLATSVLQLQWMMNTFGIFICVPMLTMGKLGDAYGRKRLFLIGLFLACITSFIAGFATHIGILIACMGLFGLSGSIILPLSQALLVHLFPENQKEKAIGLWSIFVSIALASGPVVGGIILNFWGWRWIYFINIPIFLFVIPLVIFFVQKEKEFHKPHCDWSGVGLLALIICPLIIAIMQGPNWGWGAYSTLGLFTLSIVSLIGFIFLEKRTPTPIFRPDLFAHKSFLFSAIPNACTIGIIWVVFFMIPLYLQNLRGYMPIYVGLLMLFVTLPVALFSSTVNKLYHKHGPKPLLLAGFSLLGIAALLQSLFVTESNFWPIILGVFAIGMGWVLVWGPSISCSLSSIPHKAAGIASGMFNTLQELGAVTSLAIAGVCFRLSDRLILSSHSEEIQSVFRSLSESEATSLLTNPSATFGKFGDTHIIPWLKQGFLGGYQSAFWCVFALSVVAFSLTWFLPQKKH